jgi:hypothetical protein
MVSSNDKAGSLRSENFAPGPFRPHGSVEIWRDGSVVHLIAEGPFNLETVQGVGRAMRELFASQPPQGRFVDILEMRTSIMASKEVMAAFGRFLADMSAAKTAPLAVAYVVAPGVEGRGLMLPIFARVYAENGRRFAAFETMDEARAWALEQLSAG